MPDGALVGSNHIRVGAGVQHGARLTHFFDPGRADGRAGVCASLHLPLFFLCRYITPGDGGAEEVAVPLARDLHPESGYVGSAPRVFRKLGLVSAFVVFGLMAAASGVAVFMTGPEPDPMNAMALAPSEALISTSPSSALAATAKPVEGQKTFNAGVTQSPCRDYVSERPGDDCNSVRVHRARPVQAMNERPAIAAVAIGHRED